MKVVLHKLIRRKLFSTLSGKITRGNLKISLPNGEVVFFSGDRTGYEADIAIENWLVIINLIVKGDIGFAADYRDGYWSTNNLEHLLHFALQNEKLFRHYGHSSFLFKQLSQLIYWTQRNNRKGSKNNIHAHYDLGNDFYLLWLDKSMAYSAAIFDNPEQTLDEAQQVKYKFLLNKIQKPHSNILDLGCGWGGFTKCALSDGHIVRSVTLSNEQANYARQVLKGYNANVVVEDYRKQHGIYDYIFSIEMIEHIGVKYWNTYFEKLKQLLHPDGKIILQSTVIADELFKEYASNSDMIRTFIFPGGILPSEQEINKYCKNHGLVCRNVYRFGQSCALTVKNWLNAFDNNYSNIIALGFNDSFVRLWRFYLAASIAEYTAGRCNVVQMEICHDVEKTHGDLC